MKHPVVYWKIRKKDMTPDIGHMVISRDNLPELIMVKPCWQHQDKKLVSLAS